MPLRLLAAASLTAVLAAGALAAQPPDRPFGTQREQAEQQQRWLRKRMETILPGLMRKHGVDMWVMPMREYNEDPVFSSLVSPTTFAARRRTIYVFFDRCAAAAKADPGDGSCIERLALGGTSQGGIYREYRAKQVVANPVNTRQAELWGDSQWQVLKEVIDERQPKVIGINVSRTHAFSDGMTAGELEGMSQGLGKAWTARFKRTEELPLQFIASRLPEEEEFYGKLTQLVHQLVGKMFSNEVITPGVTTTQDLVWWWRQQVNDRGLTTWFQPSVAIQRPGTLPELLGENPVIEAGDVLWCDVGITALGLNTDTQHNGYVLKPGETEPPAGLRKALANSNRLQDLLFEETRPERSGNEILRATLAKLKTEGIMGTMYSHPIGKHGHGAGPLIGLWDYQDGVPGRGDSKVIPGMWFSSELQTTSPVPEWNGQPVRIAQEEDFIVQRDGKLRWAFKRQSEFHLIRPRPAS
ncbi:MAG: aminopeptidase P family protein [Cytophagaceae bacterium]|nr:aminopeptidase P family protein [Gemmatimonadaceae bacterium]